MSHPGKKTVKTDLEIISEFNNEVAEYGVTAISNWASKRDVKDIVIILNGIASGSVTIGPSLFEVLLKKLYEKLKSPGDLYDAHINMAMFNAALKYEPQGIKLLSSKTIGWAIINIVEIILELSDKSSTTTYERAHELLFELMRDESSKPHPNGIELALLESIKDLHPEIVKFLLANKVYNFDTDTINSGLKILSKEMIAQPGKMQEKPFYAKEFDFSIVLAVKELAHQGHIPSAIEEINKKIKQLNVKLAKGPEDNDYDYNRNLLNFCETLLALFKAKQQIAATKKVAQKPGGTVVGRGESVFDRLQRKHRGQ